MGRVREITEGDRRTYENIKWSLTDPNTPQPKSKGVIARILLRTKPGSRRWEWVDKTAIEPTE